MDLAYRIGRRFGMGHSEPNLRENALRLDAFNGMTPAVRS
jgi:hypothetical protein